MMVLDSESKRRLKMSTAEFLEKPYSNISHRRNLQNEIATLYGRDIAKEARRLEMTRIKIQRRAADLDFILQSCSLPIQIDYLS